MRLLHARPDHECNRPDTGRPGRPRSRAGTRRNERQSLSLRRLCRDHRRGARRPGNDCPTRSEARGMKTFDYLRPATIAEAVAAASEPGAVYLAGGTNLLDLMKGGITQPRRLVDVAHLPGVDAIEQRADGSVRIGARVRNADLAYDATFARRFPAVAEALLSGAS